MTTTPWPAMGVGQTARPRQKQNEKQIDVIEMN